MKKIFKYSLISSIIIFIILLIYTLTAVFEDCNNLGTTKCRFNPKCRIAWVPAGPNLPAYGMGCVDVEYKGDMQKSIYFDKKNYARFELPQEDGECNTDSECFKGGCSGEKCTASEGIETTCEIPDGMISSLSCKCISERCIWTR